MLNALNNFWCEEEGATAVEYGIMVAAIAAVIITIVISIGGKTNTAFGVVAFSGGRGPTGAHLHLRARWRRDVDVALHVFVHPVGDAEIRVVFHREHGKPVAVQQGCHGA